MARYSYLITMKTQLGERRGQLWLECEQGLCQGVMTLLGTQTRISGTLASDGRCQLQGLLCTLLRTIAYTAAGTLEPERLSLTLQAGSHSYPLDGKRKERA